MMDKDKSGVINASDMKVLAGFVFVGLRGVSVLCRCWWLYWGAVALAVAVQFVVVVVVVVVAIVGDVAVQLVVVCFCCCCCEFRSCACFWCAMVVVVLIVFGGVALLFRGCPWQGKYDVSQHPGVTSKRCTEEEVMEEFISTFEGEVKDGKVGGVGGLFLPHDV